MQEGALLLQQHPLFLQEDALLSGKLLQEANDRAMLLQQPLLLGPLPLLSPMGHQRGAIEPQTPDGECAGIGQRLDGAVRERQQVHRRWFLARVPEVGLMRGHGPVVGLVPVAALTAVEQVLWIIGAAMGGGPKMVDGQFAAHGGLGHAAILARETGPLADEQAHR